MTIAFRNVTIGMLLVLALAAQGASAVKAATCVEYERIVAGAVRDGTPDGAESAFRKAETELACSGAALALLGRNAAFAFYERTRKQAISPAERASLLQRALTIGRPWQVLAAAADIERSAKRYDKAAVLYQEALDDIRDAQLNPRSPPPSLIAGLVKKAEEARLLAPEYVARRGQRGEPSGLACPSFRGFEARRTAMPIEFEYKEPGFKRQGVEALTAKGRAAADDLFDFLTRQGSPSIHLVGHTDPIGSDEYNQSLSERRAVAIKAHLVQKGYSGTIRTTGKGRTEPFEPDDPGGYSESERHQLDRRVVLERLERGSASCGS